MNEKKQGAFFGMVKVGTKGQIVIPVEARKAYNITEGDSLVLLGNGDGLAIIKPELTNEILFKIINRGE